MEPIERAEAEALADAVAAAPPDVARELGIESARIGDVVCGVLRAIPQASELSRVIGAVREDDLDAIAAFYGDAHYMISADLPELAQHGYTEGYAWMKFRRAADAQASAPTDLRIEQVGPAGASHFASVVVGAFGMPQPMARWLAGLPGRSGWACLVAYDGDSPVGAGALYIDGDTGWLGLGGTLPEARGRGAQSAILAERIAIAGRAGCGVVTTETGVREEGRPARSYRNILRAGFEESYARPNWHRP